MPLPTIPDVIRVAVEGRCSNGQPWANVFHVEKEAANAYDVAISQLHAFVATLYGAAGLRTQVSNNVSFDQVRYTPLDGISASTITTLGTVGAATDETLPPSSSIVVSHRTANRGPRYRGRTYLPQWTRGFLADDGSTSPATVATVSGYWQTFNTSVSGAAFLVAFVVASYKFSTVEPVLTSLANTEFDTQRRRRLTS